MRRVVTCTRAGSIPYRAPTNCASCCPVMRAAAHTYTNFIPACTVGLAFGRLFCSHEGVTTLLLIRHAHVHMPGPARLCGWFDPPLSRQGMEYLQRLHERGLATPRPEALYASTLQRARDTAHAFADLWQLPVQEMDALREIHCGELDGMPLGELEHRYPDLWQRNLAQCDDAFTWPGGESYRAFRRRIVDALARIAAQHQGQRVAIVTHAGVIAQVVNMLEQRPAAVWEPHRPEPLSLTRVAWADGAPAAVLTFNERCW